MPSPLRAAIGGLVALAAAQGMGRFVYTPIIPWMSASLGLSAAQGGLIASANLVGYLVGALAAGAAALPGSRWSWMVGAIGVSAVTTGALGLVSSLPAFLPLRFVGGAASAFVLVLASTQVLDRLAAAGRAGLSSVHFAGVGTGIALSAALVSAVQGAGGDWRAMWLAAGAVSALAAVAAALLVPRQDAAGIPGPAPPAALARGFGPLALGYGLFGFGYIVTATFLVAILRGTPALHGIEPLVWLLVGVTAVPSVVPWTALGARIGIAAAFAAACVLEALGVLASVLWPTVVGALLAAALLGGTLMGITALGLVAARRLAGPNPRRALGLVTAAFGVGQIAGPILAGWLHDRTGSFLLPSLLGAGALLVAAATMIPVHRALQRGVVGQS